MIWANSACEPPAASGAMMVIFLPEKKAAPLELEPLDAVPAAAAEPVLEELLQALSASGTTISAAATPAVAARLRRRACLPSTLVPLIDARIVNPPCLNGRRSWPVLIRTAL